MKKSYQNLKICYICKEKFEDKHAKGKYCKFRDHCYYTGDYYIDMLRIAIAIDSKVYLTILVFQNGSNYCYHLIVKELAEELGKQWNNIRD